MMDLKSHPTVRNLSSSALVAQAPSPISASWLRQLAVEAGADDVGFVSLSRTELNDQRADIFAILPEAKTLLSFVVRMNRENIRTPARSTSNLEFHQATDDTNEIAREIVRACEGIGVRALNPSAGFPMEADRWGEKMWTVSHKPVAVAAGLGQMGIHRNVIHPRFGNFILLGTVILACEVEEESQPINYNPCLECKLCVAACPTGAISPDGHFNFSACYTHNYREFMGGFTDWAHTLANSRSDREYEKKFTDAETVSMWQSLSFGPNYKAAYCLAVCPAGEDVISPFLNDRKQFLEEVVRPLQAKAETIYVVAGSDAESYVPRRFPNKQIKRVRNSLPVSSIANFLRNLPVVFQREQSAGIQATYHFTFTGAEQAKATVEIRDKQLRVVPDHVGKADFTLIADSETWLRFLRKRANLLWALLRRAIRIKGSPRLLLAFAKCFPS